MLGHFLMLVTIIPEEESLMRDCTYKMLVINDRLDYLSLSTLISRRWGTRVIIYAMLALMCPASSVGAIIVAIVSRTASWLKPVGPTPATVRECRFELRIVEEALAGRDVSRPRTECGSWASTRRRSFRTQAW